jgi:hypothetical protein
MTDVTGNRNAPEPIVRKQWAQNGFAPKAEFQNRITDLAAYAGYCRAKVVFIRATATEHIPAGISADRTRWRFAWNSGPFADSLYCTILMSRKASISGVPKSKLQIAKLSDVVAVGFDAAVCAEFIAQSPGGPISFFDTPGNMGASTGRLTVPNATTVYTLATDTMYVGRFVDMAYGRMVSVCAWESSKQSATDYGFSSAGVAVGAPIYAQQRNAIAELHRLLHTRGAAQLWNHCSDTDATAYIAAGAVDSGTLAQSIGTIGLTADGTVATAPITGTLSQSIGGIGLTAVAQLPAFFDAIITGTGATHSIFSPIDFTMVPTIANRNQTSATVKIAVDDGSYGGLLISSVTVTSANGWSGSFTNFSGIWIATLTRSTIAIDNTASYQVGCRITPSTINTGHIIISTNNQGVPVTAEATGTGNDVDVHLTDP